MYVLPVMTTFLNSIVEQLSNRDLAVAFWLAVLAIWFLRDKQNRKSLSSVLKALLNTTIIATLILLAAYITGIVLGLKSIGIWNSSDHLKDTVLWSITVAFVLIVNISNVQKDEQFFKNAIKDSIKLTIVLEFIVGFYPFSLPVEFVLVPILALLGGLLGIASTKQEYLPAKTILQWITAILGVFLLWHSAQKVILDLDTLLRVERLIELALLSVLTILFLPFVYLLALFIVYEQIFLRVTFQNRGSSLGGYTKRRVLQRFGLNLRRLIQWSKANIDLKVSSKDEVQELVRRVSEPADHTQKMLANSLRFYQTLAEPIMAEVRNISVRFGLKDIDSRQADMAQLRSLLTKADQLRYKDTFPLKHETLIFAIKHMVDALTYKDNYEDISANQALSRSLLNQERFSNWNVDI